MATGEKVEGRKSHAEARPDVVALAKRLARKKPKGGALSLRAISAELAEQGHSASVQAVHVRKLTD
jgi:hypothetical protein